MALTLIIGNKNYSSWSLRPWIAMKVAGIAFEEIVIPLYEPGSREQILKYSPAGKVPVLIDGDARDLGIARHSRISGREISRRAAVAGGRAARGHARAMACEMHAGFMALRRGCTDESVAAGKTAPAERGCDGRRRAHRGDVARLPRALRPGAGQGGPFLFGAFGAADAMYAPVVARFHTYGIPVAADTRAYMDAVMALPAWAEWRDAAMKEPWIMQHNEPDWPLVRGVPMSA